MNGWQIELMQLTAPPKPLSQRLPEVAKPVRQAGYCMRTDIINHLQDIDWVYVGELADMMGKHKSNVNDWIIRMPQIEMKNDARGIRMVRLK
jgi:hypothetical protein